MNDIRGRRVVLTGGSGFLGRCVKQRLQAFSPSSLHIPRSASCDLRDRRQIENLFSDCRPEIVVHLAAVVGGIGANRKNPGSYFYDNAIMGIELIEQCRQFNVKKVVVVGTICAYPKFARIPFAEDQLWEGYPEETNAPYGLAKKMLLVQAQAYRQQYGLNAIYLLPVNLYGPGDNFDPVSSHVIPALIRKVVEAQQQGRSEITVWGSGKASREFLFVEDAAEGIALATDCYNSGEPVNLGSSQEITITELTELICELVDFRGRICWDPSKPDGQPRRCLDTVRARECFGFQSRTALRVGLLETIHWYRKYIAAHSERAA